MLLILVMAAAGMCIPLSMDIYVNGRRNLLSRAGEEIKADLADRFGPIVSQAGTVTVSGAYLLFGAGVIYLMYRVLALALGLLF